MASALIGGPPPNVPEPQLRATPVPIAIVDLLSAMRTYGGFSRALLVWLQQQLSGVRVGIFDKLVSWEPLIGVRNGVNKQFTVSAGTVRLGLNGRPQASVLQGAVEIPYTANAVPAIGQWTFIQSQGAQTFILGTAPTGVPGDEPVLAFVIVQ